MDILDLNNPHPNFQMTSSVAVGVDLGQSHDPTAITVVERITGRIVPTWQNSHVEIKYRPLFVVRQMERLPLGMGYPDQVLYIARLINGLVGSRDLQGLYIDYTGVGRPVFDMFTKARLPKLVGVSITGGKESACHGSIWSVPKQELVSLVQAKLHSGDLKIPDDLPDRFALVKEFQNFRVSYTSAGNAIFNAREGTHDDMILAVCMALVGLEKRQSCFQMAI